MNPAWSWLLAVIGAAGYLLVVRGAWSGLLVGLLAQLLWLAYAVVTEQWGFLVSVCLFGGVNLWGLRSHVRRGYASTTPGTTERENRS